MCFGYISRWFRRKREEAATEVSEKKNFDIPTCLVQVGQLDFEPLEDEVIYTADGRDGEADLFMRTHLERLREVLRERHYRLVCPEMLSEEIRMDKEFWQYWNPTVKEPNTDAYAGLHGISNSYLLEHMYFPAHRGDVAKPALWSYVCDDDASDGSGRCHLFYRLELNPAETDIEGYFSAIQSKIIFKYQHGPLYSLVRPNDADEGFETETERLMAQARSIINRLRGAGISEVVLSGLLLPPTELSRLHITKDNRIFLTDFGNREVVMTPLVKAVFFLFLRHPEGIVFKELSDYSEELATIYGMVREKKPVWKEFGLRKKITESIMRLTNPTDNSINEKCARIREAFLLCVNDNVARHYYVTGKRGEPKRIILPPDMIDWDRD